MDALLLALILGLILDQGTASQRICARLGQGPVSGRLIGGVLLAILANAALATLFGALLSAVLPQLAALLFLAIALLIGGIGLMLLPIRGARSDSASRSIPVLILRRAGENGALVIAAIAAFTHAPLFTLAGAVMGGMAGLLPPLLLGIDPREVTAIRIGAGVIGVILVGVAIACAVNALRLV